MEDIKSFLTTGDTLFAKHANWLITFSLSYVIFTTFIIMLIGAGILLLIF